MIDRPPRRPLGPPPPLGWWPGTGKKNTRVGRSLRFPAQVLDHHAVPPPPPARFMPVPSMSPRHVWEPGPVPCAFNPFVTPPGPKMPVPEMALSRLGPDHSGPVQTRLGRTPEVQAPSPVPVGNWPPPGCSSPVSAGIPRAHAVPSWPAARIGAVAPTERRRQSPVKPQLVRHVPADSVLIPQRLAAFRCPKPPHGQARFQACGHRPGCGPQSSGGAHPRSPPPGPARPWNRGLGANPGGNPRNLVTAPSPNHPRPSPGAYPLAPTPGGWEKGGRGTTSFRRAAEAAPRKPTVKTKI